MALRRASGRMPPLSKMPTCTALALFVVTAALGSGTQWPPAGELAGGAAPRALADDDACRATGSGLGQRPCGLSALQLSAYGRLGQAVGDLSGLVYSSTELVSSSALAMWGPIDTAAEAVKRFIPILNVGKDEPDRECHMGPSESCPIAEMSGRRAVAVSPGGLTACIDSERSYQFEVIPGDLDKFLLFFAQGGACWDEWSTLADHHLVGNPGLCFHRPKYSQLDKDATDTLFSDYTIVSVLYCSGDLHFGNVTRPYKLPSGARVRQHGYYNAKAAIDWARANLAPQLSSLVLVGASAGALGMIAWSHSLLSDLEYARATVIMDSFFGIFPEGAAHSTVHGLGMCTLGLLPEALASSCADLDGGSFEIEDTLEYVMSEFPNVAFAHINSKQDKLQIFFYDAVSYAFGKNSWFTVLGYSAGYDQRMNQILTRYLSHPNYAFFSVNGNGHCFTCFPMTHSVGKDFQVRGQLDVCKDTGWLFRLLGPPGPSLGACVLRLVQGPRSAAAAAFART